MRALVEDRVPVVITGPAGIGKTSVARAALEPHPSREGGALSTLAWSPLLVFRRILRRDLPDSPESVAAAVLRQGTEALLLDDLQWCDDASLQVVAHLAGRLPLVITVRHGEDRSDEVIDVLRLLGAEVVELAGLPPEESEPLVRHLHPQLDAAGRKSLLATAEGNPLLLHELPRDGQVPSTLLSALLARVGSLHDEARSSLHRLAVLGRPCGADVLGPGAAELPGSGLAELQGDSLVVRHVLLAEIIVEDLGPLADDIRRDLAGVVEPDEAAHLLFAAGELTGARAHALRAAETGDRRQQAEMLGLAVRCATDLDVETRLAAARLFLTTDQPLPAAELCAPEGMEDLERADRGALRTLGAEAAWVQGRHQEGATLAEAALEDLRGTRTGWEVRILAASTMAQTFLGLDGRPALERAREAVRLADEVGEQQAFARSRLASVLATSGEPGWGDLQDQVIHEAAEQGDHELRRTALIGAILGRWVAGDPAGAEELARREIAAGMQHGADLRWLTIAAYLAVLGLQLGRRPEELVDEFRPILEREPLFRSRSFMETAVILALADQGDVVAADGLAVGTLARAGNELQARAVALWAVAESAWLGGDPGRCLAAVADVLALGLGDYPAATQARLIGAHACWELGQELVGPAPAALQPAWRGVPIEWAGLVAASTGETEEAVARFEEAAQAYGGLDRRSELRCRWAAGHASAAIGGTRAAELLVGAEEQARTGGSVALEGRVRRSLRRIGVDRRSTASPGVAGLTMREEQVLDLVRAGRTTPQIAAALGLSESTVTSFVKSATRRLGATGRVDAAIRLEQLRRTPRDPDVA